MTSDPWQVAWSAKVYAALLRGYPASFRKDYQEEMSLLFRELARDAWHRGGWFTLAALWRRALVDLLSTIPRQHWSAWQGATPMKIAFSIGFVAAAVLIGAGWVVDYLSAGDPHWLDGSGLALLVVLAVAAAIIPRTSTPAAPGRQSLITPNRRCLIGAAALALTTGGLVYTFVGDRIDIGDRSRPLLQSPSREVAALAILAVVFALARSVLLRIQQIPAARRKQTFLSLAGWGLAGVLAAISAAGLLVWRLSLDGILPHPDLIYSLTFAAALLTLLVIERSILSLFDRWTGEVAGDATAS